MRLLTCVLVALIMVVGTASAASPVHTEKGDKAMVFTFHGLGELGLSGYGDDWGLGLRYYLSDMNALRAGLLFGMSSFTEKGIAEGEADLEDSESAFGIDLNYERHLGAPCASVSPYIGGGIGYWSWSGEFENIDLASRDNPKITEDESGFYFQGIAGFEWGFTDCMTLGGEYQLGWASGSWKQEYDPVEGETQTWDEEEFSFMGFHTASVFLSVYW